MKKFITLIFICFSISLLFSCSKDNLNFIEVEPSQLRNGSTSLYTLYDKKGKEIYTFKDNVFVNPDNILIVRELTEKDNEEVLRIKLDPRYLSPIQVQIVKSEKQSEKPKFSGDKKGRSYIITEWDDNNNASYKRIYIGSEQFFEDEVMLHIISTFPLNEGAHKNFKYVNTRKKISGDESYKVIGLESLIISGNKYETVKVEIPGNNCKAWYLKDSPHILLKAEFPSMELRLTGWNNI